MQIKQDKKSIIPQISKLILGSSDKELRLYTIGATIGIWTVILIIVSIIFLINSNTTDIFLETIIKGGMAASSVGGVLAIIAVFGSNDFNRTDGWKIWWRIVIYNSLLFLSMFYIQHNSAVNDIKEPVISYDTIQSDIDKCEYKTILRSKNLVYTHCSYKSDLQTELTKLQNGTAVIKLVRMFDYTNVADHYEITTTKTFIKKDK